jgi:hypothetical protein
LPDVASIDIQTEIQWYMRPYLLDFLIEAHAAFGLLPETLFLAINILDRYCSKRVVYRRHYQLVGCTALLIAAKYGECSKKVPHIKELANMCCSLYDEDMFTQMEKHVMITLDWFVGHPTVDAFLQIALDGGAYQPELESMARYIAEVALFHREFVSTRASELARASLALARIVLGRPQPHPLEWAADYDVKTVSALSRYVQQPSQILFHKYGSRANHCASDMLKELLMRQLAATENPAAPPTPPQELPCPGGFGTPVAAHHFATPSKSRYYPSMPHGCPTPPDTPDFERTVNFASACGGAECPAGDSPSALPGQPPQKRVRTYHEADLMEES